MFWIICYDTPSDKRRREIVKIMESYGQRAQYSVFECDITDREQITLEGKLGKVVDEDEDDIRFYPLNQADIKRVRTLGKNAKMNFLNDAEII
jgi:CRISPR-associated protein Cas2